MKRYLVFWTGVAVLALVCGVFWANARAAQGQAAAPAVKTANNSNAAPAETPQGARPMRLWEIVRAGGWIELVIFLCSIAGVALIIEHFITIRFVRMMPPEFISAIQELIRAKQYKEALRMAKESDTPFARIVIVGLEKLRHDFSTVEDAVADELDRVAVQLHSKIGYLSLIATVSPMLGLLGTVFGMIKCFNRIAYSTALSRSAMLAEGVSQALVTTATGLLVAIPVMAFYFYFRDKVNRIMIDMESEAMSIFEPFRPVRRGGSTGSSA